MNRYIYNSRDLKHKRPFGAVKNTQKISFTIYALDGVYINSINFVLNKDGEEPNIYKMRYNGKIKEGTSKFSLDLIIEDVGLYWYYFVSDTEAGIDIIKKGNHNEASTTSQDPFQLTVYDKDYRTPNYIKGGIIYHIFVDRFNKSNNYIDFKKTKPRANKKEWDDEITIVDSDGIFRANDFFCGNFKGIEEKLNYLKSLNVSMLYLSPIFESPSNHRYDTSNYMSIDPLLGDDNDFKSLVENANKIGIKIMLDGVFNHTGSDSIYFNKDGNYSEIGAYQSKDSKYYSWYDFNDYPNDYRCWWGVKICPSVNQNNSDYINYITGRNGVISHWNSFGIGGWRLDVVDELKPSFVKHIRQTVKKDDEDRLLIGEIWEDASSKISYSLRREYFLGKELDGVMNYVFRNAIIDYTKYNNIDSFINTVLNICENYPRQSLDVSLTLLGTHDTIRILTELSGIDLRNTSKKYRLKYLMDEQTKEKAISLLKIASLIQYVLPGIPSIYYGDETGLEGYEDPLNRKVINWDNVNSKILNHYKALGNIRKNYKDCFLGDIELYNNNNMLFIKRIKKDGCLNILINNTEDQRILTMNSSDDILLSERFNNGILFSQGFLVFYKSNKKIIDKLTLKRNK